MKVAIQGQKASFHDIAARRHFGDIEPVCRDTFAEVFNSVKSGQADRGMVAIENSLYGSINDVYDLLLQNGVVITGEVYLKISQCLIGFPGTSAKDIAEVHSHPVALAQCEDFINKQLPDAERFEHTDTAGSVADIKQWGDPARAAIASQAAAELHGMEVLAKDIETNKQNYTRFVTLSSGKANVAGANKTSMVLTTPADTKPGALYRALGCFDEQNINMLMLQSRPLIGRAWHYLFYIDIAAGMQDNRLKTALANLHEQNCQITILGSYKNGMPKLQ